MKNQSINKFRHLFTLAFIVVSLSACSVVDNLVDVKRSNLNYKNNDSVKTLDFPPDLTAPEFDNAFVLPAGGVATASSIMGERGNGYSSSRAKVNVLPSSAGVRFGGVGTVRWLDVDQSAELLWPALRDFWRSVGISVKRDEPRIGIMETAWSENRAGLPMDFLRSVMNKAIQRSFDAGTRDKYQIRVEKRSAKATRIFLTHKGAQEKTSTGWELRPANHVYEAELLNRLKAFLQGDIAAATGKKDLPVSSKLNQTTSLVSIVGQEGQTILQVHDNYKRAWALTGIMLDRMGLVMEKKNPTSGIYHLQYQGNDEDVNRKGFFKRIFRDRVTILLKEERYQVHVQDTGKLSVVRIFDKEGKPLSQRQTRLALARLKKEFDR